MDVPAPCHDEFMRVTPYPAELRELTIAWTGERFETGRPRVPDGVLANDDRPTDLCECLRAHRDVGFDGVLRPDHVPSPFGEPSAR